MATVIRLARAGTKKRPYYKVVVADSRKPRDGDFIEVIGSYNPLLKDESDKRVNLQKDRVDYWLSVGAQPSMRMVSFFNKAGIAQDNKMVKESNKRLKQVIKDTKEGIEKKKKAEEAKAAAEAAKTEGGASAAGAAA